MKSNIISRLRFIPPELLIDERLAPTYVNKIKHLSGSDCNWSNKTLGIISDDVFCQEGQDFNEGEICTLSCLDSSLLPTFAKLQCFK